MTKQVQTGSWILFIAVALVAILMAYIFWSAGDDAAETSPGDGAATYGAYDAPGNFRVTDPDASPEDAQHSAEAAIPSDVDEDEASASPDEHEIATGDSTEDATVDAALIAEGQDAAESAVDRLHADSTTEEHDRSPREEEDDEEEQDLVTMIGRVVDRYDGQPIGGASVGVMGTVNEPTHLVSSEDGSFTAELRPHARLHVRIEAEGYTTREFERFSAPPGVRSFEREFTLGVGGGIVGFVVRGDDEEPVPDATVDILGFDVPQFHVPSTVQESTRSDEIGFFAFEGLRSGEALLRFTPQDRELTPRLLRTNVYDADVTDLGNVKLQGQSGIVARVFHSGSGAPFSNLAVTVRSDGTHDFTFRQNMMTDAAGEVRFSVPRNGLYAIDLIDFELVSYVQLFAEEEKEVLVPVGNATLRATVTLDGDPIRARVRFYRDDGVANVSQRWRNVGEDGIYEAERLSGGEWFALVNPTVEGLESQRFPVRIRDGEHHEEEFAYHNLLLSGEVLLADGQPAASARVSARGGTDERYRTTTAGLDGEFTVTGLTEGTYVVRASLTGHGDAEETVQIPSSVPVRLNLAGGGDHGTVHSMALDYHTGMPISGAWLDLQSTDGRFHERYTGRNDDGILTASSVPTGEYTAEVSFWGYSVARRNIRVTGGGTERLDDALYRAGALRVTWEDSGAEVNLSLTPDDPSSIEEPRTADAIRGGEWVLRGLYPGRYTLAVQRADMPPSYYPITIDAGALASFVLP